MMQVIGNATLIQNSTLRELRTALEVYDKSEYTGGRERAGHFLALVARDLITGVGNFDAPAAVNTTTSIGGTAVSYSGAGVSGDG